MWLFVGNADDAPPHTSHHCFSRGHGRHLLLGDHLPPGRHQVPGPGGRMGPPPEIPGASALPEGQWSLQFCLTLQCFVQETIKEGGWKILYRGFGSTTYRAFIVNGVILLVYNNIMRYYA